MDTDVIMVLTTVQSPEEAEKIATILIEERLAACVQMALSIRSYYRWKGEVHNDPEQLLLLKTRKALLPDVVRRIKDLHSYEVPEIIAVPVIGGLDTYLQWVKKETSHI